MEHARRFQGKICEDYGLVPLGFPNYHRLQELLAREIAARYIAPLVVDVGVGTGVTASTIIAHCSGSTVLGVDHEDTMLRQANINLAPEIAAGRVQINHGDAIDFLQHLAPGSVNVVASSFTIHNCNDDYRAVLEQAIFAALAPDGMFINSDKYASDDREEWVREIATTILGYDVLIPMGHTDLRRVWIEHEIGDQEPERILWTQSALRRLTDIGFQAAQVIHRLGQYAIVTAFKSSV
jgi:SAM-dependent methyltransferase